MWIFILACVLSDVWSDLMGVQGLIWRLVWGQILAPEAACGLTYAVQMNFTVTDRTQMTAVYSNSHHWNPMQTPRCFKYVVSFSCQWWAAHGALQRFTAHLSAGKCLKVTCRIACLTPFEDVVSLRLKIPMQILLSGPSSGDQGLSYQHIYHLWTYALHPVPPAKSSPPLPHCRLIFCVSELWIVVLPHCNKQMAARSWVITNPLREWLVLSRAALIRARWLSPLFAQALKSSSGLVTHRVCSG